MQNPMNILAIIPARGASKGIPRKNLKLLNDKPLINHTIQAALESKYVTRSIVSTEDKEIMKISKSLNVEVLKRPKELADDNSPLEPVMHHVLDHLKQKENYMPDLIILLQATSPLRNAKHIDESIVELKRKKLDSILSVSESKALVWKKQSNSQITPITYDPQNRQNRQQMKDKLLENGAIYITKYKLFKKNNCRISGKIGFYKMSNELSYEIDKPYELELVEKILTQDSHIDNDIFSVKGKNIVLTGASGLLGNHYARTLLERGAHMALIDHNPHASILLKKEFDDTNKIEVYECDLSKPNEIINTFKKIKKKFGRIDALINNAAYVSSKTFHIKDFKNYETHPFQQWRNAFKVNVDAVHICCQESLKIMKNQKEGSSIINISSNYGLVSPAFDTYSDEKLWTPPGYAVTKSAILNLTRYIAHLYGRYNIRCNTFTPSGVATKNLSKKFQKKYGNLNAFGRMAKIEDYTGAIVFLCSDASKYMTGANLIIDGGWTAR